MVRRKVGRKQKGWGRSWSLFCWGTLAFCSSC